MNDEEIPRRPDKLHRPWRLVAAGCELVVAAIAVWCAIRVWGLGVRTLTETLSDGTRLLSTRFIGSWMAGAIALGALAAILVVDAVREVLLGIDFRPRRRLKRAAVDGGLTHLNEG